MKGLPLGVAMFLVLLAGIVTSGCCAATVPEASAVEATPSGPVIDHANYAGVDDLVVARGRNLTGSGFCFRLSRVDTGETTGVLETERWTDSAIWVNGDVAKAEFNDWMQVCIQPQIVKQPAPGNGWVIVAEGPAFDFGVAGCYALTPGPPTPTLAGTLVRTAEPMGTLTPPVTTTPTGTPTVTPTASGQLDGSP